MKQIPVLFGLIIGILLCGCANTKHYTRGPVKVFDPDTSAIPQPEQVDRSRYWEQLNYTLFHQLRKPLNLNTVGRSAGMVLGISEPREADNINVLDEPPESSWYNYRHFYNPMTLEELANGPNETAPPDTTGNWTIFQASIGGPNAWFFIEDRKGDRYLIKFDSPDFPELRTSSEVISTKFFHAAGYNVPEATITYLNPSKFTIKDSVMVREGRRRREMTQADIKNTLLERPRNRFGKVRTIAIKFVEGTPIGPWGFEGTRDDDPNDRVAHEHRRELRGLRVISSWLNDTDRRDANSLAVYTEGGYVKHYLQDFGSTLGANGAGVHTPIDGQAYLIDPRYMALNTLSLGMNVNVWEKDQAITPFPSVGYFRSDIFEPEEWVTAHPLPAFENMTLRDAYWGAKQVMSFSDEDIRRIVKTGRITNGEAQSFLWQILINRRDKIGEYWFSRINPLDKFRAEITNGDLVLHFVDLGVEGNIFRADNTRYRYEVFAGNKQVLKARGTEENRAIFNIAGIKQTSSEASRVINFRLYTEREDIGYKPVKVYVALEKSGPRIVGVNREQ
ncbi:hypothetical protein G3570_12200 [Balneolaceae bacterium YR4-1]|uniref:Uncharacterized protein n=1 Tax=Halalkalibaculum roseum TaxID=2709311 RepID=A0A6M1SWH2_9BACT|nr:hypothetical protein [Halalkalibaculum roseum]